MPDSKVRNSTTQEKEIWMDVPGYEGYYQASSLGRVRSLDRSYKVVRYGKEYTYNRKGKLLNPYNHRQGYKKIDLNKNGCRSSCFVHRIVLASFLGESDLDCNHINGIKDDNKLINLEYVTQQKNSIHAIHTGLYEANKGEKHHKSKLKKSDVIEIKKLLREKNLTQEEIGRIFNVRQTQISNIKNGYSWGHL